ncbi:MAG: hypothetical protein NCW75_09725 [Phycisphaera sp.]|nr:MAG: hypothetical protein NCW75_09725 [Phycisphaera sp.]
MGTAVGAQGITYDIGPAGQPGTGGSARPGVRENSLGTDVRGLNPSRIPDCNENGTHDLLDIANGDSADVNLNGIPDECEVPPCYADLDGDGELTLFDFLAFQNAFDTGDPAADCDADGSLTLFDFLCFQNAFDTGC